MKCDLDTSFLLLEHYFHSVVPQRHEFYNVMNRGNPLYRKMNQLLRLNCIAVNDDLRTLDFGL
jgi:hypothetical protein